MSAVPGLLEARITVPTGGWDVSANAGAGAFTATVPAGSYFVVDLAYELEDVLNAGAGGTWTFTDGCNPDLATATGKLTIACGATFSITWTDTELRDILGFAGNIVSAATPQTGTSQMLGVWLPGCPKMTPYGDGIWDTQSDMVQSLGPSNGAVKTLQGNAFEMLEGVSWSHVANAKAVGATVVGSWQHFWKAISTSLYSYITPGNLVRFTWTAGVSNHVHLVVPASSSIQPVVSGWTGLYKVEIPMITRVV